MSAVLASPLRIRAARIAVNVLAFQAAWFACVGAAARGAPAWGMAAIAAAVALHFAWSGKRAADALLVVIAVALGAVWDTMVVRAGWVDYAAPGPLAGFAPAWILALWALFATTLREPLRWMHGRAWLAALFGAVGGPMSYLAAERMGACRFADPVTSLAALGIGWAVMTPLLVEVARRVDTKEDTR